MQTFGTKGLSCVHGECGEIHPCGRKRSRCGEEEYRAAKGDGNGNEGEVPSNWKRLPEVPQGDTRYGGHGNRGYPQAETPASRFRYRGRFEVKRLILACWRGADELRAEVSSTVMPKGKKNGGNAGSGGSPAGATGTYAGTPNRTRRTASVN